MEWHRKVNTSQLKKETTMFSLLLLRIYVLLCTTFFFKSFVDIMQCNNENFWEGLRLHVGPKIVLFHTECSYSLEQGEKIRPSIADITKQKFHRTVFYIFH